MAVPSSTSTVSLQRGSGKRCPFPQGRAWRPVMTFSYTQVAQYLRCPKSYRFRYLDGWRERETRAPLVFGRCFEKALAAFSERQDSAAALFKVSRTDFFRH